MHQRRSFSRATVLASLLTATSILSACGSNDGGTTAPPTAPPTAPTSPTVPAGSYPTDPDVALVRVGFHGDLPAIVIGGDGWAYSPIGDDGRSDGYGRAATELRPQAVPAPPEPTPVERRQLTPAGVRIVLDLAANLGLLAVPDEYEDPGITDHASTYVELTDNAGTYEHDAYALGAQEESGNRQNLLEFVETLEDLQDLERLVGDENLGPPELYVPAVFMVSLRGSYLSDGVDVPWPDDVPVEEGCVELPVDRFPEGVSGLYIADIDGEPTRVSAIPDLPGDACT